MGQMFYGSDVLWVRNGGVFIMGQMFLAAPALAYLVFGAIGPPCSNLAQLLGTSSSDKFMK